MTREELIEGLKLLEDNMVYFDELLNDKGKWIDVHELLFEAIEALEQEPTTKENLVVEDCISREEVCDYIAEFVNHEYATDRERELVKHIIGGIQHLPSIQPKTGHWVSKHIVDDCNGVVTWYECSECGRSVDETVTEKFMLKDYPYCHCGAKMLPTDSEKE